VIHRPAPARGGAPGVVFLHGFTGDRMESHWIFVKCARALARAGIASIRFDFYGSGESDGEFGEVTLPGEVADAEAAVDFFRGQPGIDPDRIGLLGMSLGGAVAAAAAPRVQAAALVLWSAVARPAQLAGLSETAARPLDGFDGVEYGGHRISRGFLDSLSAIDPLGSVARFKQATVMIHPEKDEILPLSNLEDYFEHCGAVVKQKVVILDADHVFTSVGWEQDVISRTVAWFSTYLPGAVG
jgi:pimeloyl-ACP methyl ester carboxylesterase